MSASETSPLLVSGVSYESTRTLHESETTLVGDPTDTRGTCQCALNQDRPRTLVLCFDGTGDQFGDDNSNVIQFFSCLKKDNETQQLVYYQAGIGTYTNSTFVTPITNKLSRVLDEMIAWNLSAHVQEGYEYLMQNYRYGDSISIFGFSRGAYTARALAGMIQKVGLLPKYNKAQIPFAWAMYTREDSGGLTNSEAFKKTFSIDIVIDFVGVWDTVASVGIISKELPFVANNTAIRVFRHALSLDEHRAKFMPAFYQAAQNAEPRTAKTAGTVSILDASMPLSTSSTSKVLDKNSKTRKIRASPSECRLWEHNINLARGRPTDALEVWFAGCHCDIGGGSVSNKTRHSLARIPLRWMIRECFKNETGILFDKNILKADIGIDADALYPVMLERPLRKSPIGMQLNSQMESQGYAITTILMVVGGLLVIPVNIVLGVIAWPLKHFILLFKFTRTGKRIRGVFDSSKLSTAPESERTMLARSSYGALPDVGNPGNTATGFVSEEDEELADSLMPVYDQLSIRWFWWILEIIPFRFREQKGKRDDFFVRANWGRGRKIYGDAKRDGIMVHRSVKTRLEVVDNMGKSVYRPKAWFEVGGASGEKKARLKDWNVENPEEWEWVD